MAGITGQITENRPGITFSDRDILLHLLQHAESQDAMVSAMSARIDDLTAPAGVMGAQVAAMHAELEAARPLLDKWARNPLLRAASGRMPL